MKIHGFHRTAIALGAAVLLTAPAAVFGEAGERATVSTTPHFAFYSDLATNLNDALIAAGRARAAGEAEPFHGGPEKACFDGLPPAERAGWNGAVGFYTEVVSPAGTFGREQMLVRYQLAGIPGAEESDEDRRLVEIARGFRAAAAPAFEACRWPARDAENRRWIEELAARLSRHEEGIARRLEELYDQPWQGLPIPVDAVETVDRTGANTTFRPGGPGGHVLISTGYEGPSALEGVFHEASHLLMGFGAPVRDALMAAGRELGVSLEGRRWHDLWHSALFYTTGEVVREALTAAGEPAYTPLLYAEDIYGRYHEPLESTWPAYLRGDRTLSEAAADLVRAMGYPPSS